MGDAKKMLTQSEVELLARDALTALVNESNCQSVDDVANVLMKACSLAGVMMVATVGQEEAVARLHGTAEFISKQNFGRWTKETVQ